MKFKKNPFRKLFFVDIFSTMWFMWLCPNNLLLICWRLIYNSYIINNFYLIGIIGIYHPIVNIIVSISYVSVLINYFFKIGNKSIFPSLFSTRATFFRKMNISIDFSDSIYLWGTLFCWLKYLMVIIIIFSAISRRLVIIKRIYFQIGKKLQCYIKNTRMYIFQVISLI